MVWFFVRGSERVQMDTFVEHKTSEFVVRLFYPDGNRSIERFPTLADFRKGIHQIERRLAAEHWSQDGGPVFIPEGFPKRRLS